MSKIETTSKVSLKLASMINLGRWSARAELSTLDTAHTLPHSHERDKPIETFAYEKVNLYTNFPSSSTNFDMPRELSISTPYTMATQPTPRTIVTQK